MGKSLKVSRGPAMSKPAQRVRKQTDMIRARVQPELKHQAENVFKDVGLTPSEAIRLFYRQVVLRKGLPFEVKVPNAETREAIRQADAGELTRYQSVADLMEKLGAS